MDLKKLGDLFYERRVLRRMTMRKLSELSGVSRDAISRLETGENIRVSLDVIIRLGRVLDISLSEVEAVCDVCDEGVSGSGVT